MDDSLRIVIKSTNFAVECSLPEIKTNDTISQFEGLILLGDLVSKETVLLRWESETLK